MTIPESRTQSSLRVRRDGMRPLLKSKCKEMMWSSNWNVVIASLFLSVSLGLFVLTTMHLDSHTAPPMAVARRFEVNAFFTVRF